MDPWTLILRSSDSCTGLPDKTVTVILCVGFPGGSEGKASACNAGDPGSIPWSGRSPGEGNGNPLQYSCLENLMDGGAWWATVHGVAKSRTRLSDFTSLHFTSLLMLQNPPNLIQSKVEEITSHVDRRPHNPSEFLSPAGRPYYLLVSKLFLIFYRSYS